MVRIAICDADEKACYEVRNDIADILESHGIEHKTDIFFDAQALFRALHDKLYEYVICDVSDGNEDMISLAEKLREEKYPIHFIFSADNTDRAKRAFEVFPVAFFEKPITREKLSKLFCYLFTFKSAHTKFYVSAKNGEKHLIAEAGIEYIEVFHNDICIHLTDGRDIVCRSTLTAFLQKLGGDFVRCHQSYAVNISRARSIKRYSLLLESGKSIPVSKNNYLFVRDRIINDN